MTDKLLELAAKLPSGLNDPKVVDKFLHEYQELDEALATGDRIGSLLEAADCFYYLAKIQYQKMDTPWSNCANKANIVEKSGFSEETIRAAALIKYGLRARPGNPKNDQEERAAVAHLVS